MTADEIRKISRPLPNVPEPIGEENLFLCVMFQEIAAQLAESNARWQRIEEALFAGGTLNPVPIKKGE